CATAVIPVIYTLSLHDALPICPTHRISMVEANLEAFRGCPNRVGGCPRRPITNREASPGRKPYVDPQRPVRRNHERAVGTGQTGRKGPGQVLPMGPASCQCPDGATYPA